MLLDILSTNVLNRIVVCMYFSVTGFQFDRHVTYSKRRARSEWKLYQVRLRCVKGARIPIPKDRLSIRCNRISSNLIAEQKIYNSSRIGSFVVAFLTWSVTKIKVDIIILVAKNMQVKYSYHETMWIRHYYDTVTYRFLVPDYLEIVIDFTRIANDHYENKCKYSISILISQSIINCRYLPR